jgi:hypothetical protein
MAYSDDDARVPIRRVHHQKGDYIPGHRLGAYFPLNEDTPTKRTVCKSRSGVIRETHDRDKDGVCIFCDHRKEER